jgi:hypothetical protein
MKQKIEGKMSTNSFFEAIKLPIKYKVIIAISSGILIFIPSEWTIKWFGIHIYGSFRIIIGIVFIVSLAITVVEILIELVKLIMFLVFGNSDYLLNRKKFKKIEDKLSEQEKEIIAMYIQEDTEFLDLPVNNGVVIELEKKRIIKRQGEIGTGFMNFSYKMSSEVFRYLKEQCIE